VRRRKGGGGTLALPEEKKSTRSVARPSREAIGEAPEKDLVLSGKGLLRLSLLSIKSRAFAEDDPPDPENGS